MAFVVTVTGFGWVEEIASRVGGVPGTGHCVSKQYNLGENELDIDTDQFAWQEVADQAALDLIENYIPAVADPIAAGNVSYQVLPLDSSDHINIALYNEKETTIDIFLHNTTTALEKICGYFPFSNPTLAALSVYIAVFLSDDPEFDDEGDWVFAEEMQIFRDGRLLAAESGDIYIPLNIDIPAGKHFRLSIFRGSYEWLTPFDEINTILKTNLLL